MENLPKYVLTAHCGLEGAVGLIMMSSAKSGTMPLIGSLFPVLPSSPYPMFLGLALTASAATAGVRLVNGEEASKAETVGMAVYHVVATGLLLKILKENDYKSDPVPFLFHSAMTAGLGYILYNWKDKKPRFNTKIALDKSKVVDSCAFKDIEDADAVYFCRCWKSSKFPYCDGSHNKYNKETGDNLGPRERKIVCVCVYVCVCDNLGPLEVKGGKSKQQ